MKLENYEEFSAGGNCTALSRLFGNNKEIILTDLDGGRSPSRFPLWASWYYLGRRNGDRTLHSLSELRELEALVESIA